MLPTAAEWRARGRDIVVRGHRLFVVEAGPRDAPVLALLHGFPSTSWDFHAVLPALAARYRVIVHDHVGFGFSEKPSRYSWSIVDQAANAAALWQALGVRELQVLAHDYGCSVATELFHQRSSGALPVTLRSATLVNSGLYYDLAGLRLAQHLLRIRWTRPLASRLSGRLMFGANMRALWGAPTPGLDEELDVLWEMLVRDGGKVAIGRLSHYLEERRWIHKERWNAAIRAFDAPAHVLWGDRDPVGIPAIAEKLARELPRATLTWLPGLGHYPMLESPERFATAALAFLDTQVR